MKLSFIAISAALVISLAGCERRSAGDATINTAVKNKLAADPTTSAATGATPTTMRKNERSCGSG